LPSRWEGAKPGERSGDKNNSEELAECLRFCRAELSLPEDKPRAQSLDFHNLHLTKERKLLGYNFQRRRYFPCIEKQQNCCNLAKQWETAPKPSYILFVKAEGSNRIILKRKTEHLGGMETFLRTGNGSTARNNCQKQTTSKSSFQSLVPLRSHETEIIPSSTSCSP